MNLSTRATEYLKLLRRNPNWITDEKSTINYFKSLNLPKSDQLLKTQLKYSGYELAIQDDEKNKYNINFISKNHINKKTRIYTELVDNEVIMDFENNSKSYNYFISANGSICTRNEENPRKIHFSYDNIETKIEQFAFLNEFYYYKSSPESYLEIVDMKKLEERLSKFTKIEECCDTFNQCFKDDRVIVFTSPWIGANGFSLVIYGIHNSFCKEIVHDLIKNNIIE